MRTLYVPRFHVRALDEIGRHIYWEPGIVCCMVGLGNDCRKPTCSGSTYKCHSHLTLLLLRDNQGFAIYSIITIHLSVEVHFRSQGVFRINNGPHVLSLSAPPSAMASTTKRFSLFRSNTGSAAVSIRLYARILT